MSLSPLWGAVIGWRFLGDILPLRTKLAVAGALVSIGLIFAPRVVSGTETEEHHPRPNRLAGNLVAIVTGVGLAGYGNAVRYASKRHPQLPTQVAQIFSNLNALVVCLVIETASAWPIVIHRPGRLWWVTLLMGFLINTAYLGFNVAPKFITAAEFGIICLLEAVLGPVWVFLLVGEIPSVWTCGGGLVLLSTMVAHEVATMLALRASTSATTVLVTKQHQGGRGSSSCSAGGISDLVNSQVMTTSRTSTKPSMDLPEVQIDSMSEA
uniref:EamA domain-containing protein n=1 Tax=Haptolina ericina TaxID=156174 RepID=A0A7S3AZG5_9EUKA|mmetsp:Transcript_43852/g.99125  ORF Transcript_43852/g.99125 Transcript_43852/m.99125 type:complete len:267 (+) Transcript_43852:97-897(+)